MRWPILNHTDGQIRTRKAFAWQPTTVIDNGTTIKIWLECYLISEQFVKYQKEVIEEWRILELKSIKKGAQAP